MTDLDRVVLALTAYRENRGGGQNGMQSVMNVIINRSKARGTSPYEECVRPLQFSSITEGGDSQLVVWPALGDPQFESALSLASLASLGCLADITEGATLYYAPRGIPADSPPYTLPDGSKVPFPKGWNPDAVKFVNKIAGQLFFLQA